ncbi:hypothetical protein GWI33_006403 [Rhynchophorus ferrugineus]|uniref:Uncharacterized protein n=1 Tax=Rhynchophorus ferrugineus TaxID=354439 RepID=A0A834IIS5_RHYFE|nr:hypothetical protein GWI33_006403 [Rhynchophorus ferrugineus]
MQARSSPTPGVIHDRPLLVSIYVKPCLLLGTTLTATDVDGLLRSYLRKLEGSETADVPLLRASREEITV